VIIALGAALAAAAPVTLINPERIYTDLIKPSLVALWLSQRSSSRSTPGSRPGSTSAGCPPGR
jgi:hypothetical protein